MDVSEIQQDVPDNLEERRRRPFHRLVHRDLGDGATRLEFEYDPSNPKRTDVGAKDDALGRAHLDNFGLVLAGATREFDPESRPLRRPLRLDSSQTFRPGDPGRVGGGIEEDFEYLAAGGVHYRLVACHFPLLSVDALVIRHPARRQSLMSNYQSCFPKSKPGEIPV